jgi:hypothetical protein
VSVDPEHLKRQIAQLMRAQFDIRSADSLAEELDSHHGSISPLAWGLFTGMAVSYARPFATSKLFGNLPARWRKFPDRPELAAQHQRLIDFRNGLVAHNDATTHRVTKVFPRGEIMRGSATVVEGRSPIHTAGIKEARVLFQYQVERLSEHGGKLVNELDKLGAIPTGGLEF